VALVVQLDTEIVSRVDVTDLARGNPDDRLVSVAIGDDRSTVRLLGQVRDVHSVVVEVDRKLTQPTNIGGGP
jgi:RecJ-like exonuclease